MPSDLRTHYFQAASKGQNDDDNPDLFDRLEGDFILNLLPHKQGSLMLRGGIRDRIALNTDLDADAFPCGVWTHGQNLLIGYRQYHATEIVEPWVAWLYPQSGSTLSEAYVAGGTIKYDHVNTQSGTVTRVTNADRALQIGPRFTRIGNYVYGPAYDTTDNTNTAENVMTQADGGQHRVRSILRWDGTAAAPTEYANAPKGGLDVTHHHNRLWVLGGRDPNHAGTTPAGTAVSDYINPSALYYSDPIDPDDTPTVPDTVAAWQDSNSATQKIIVDSGNDNDIGVALARVGQNLIILKRYSLHILHGYSPDTFNLKPIRTDLGCIDARSVVEVDGGVYFMSSRGYVFFDGQEIRDIGNRFRSSAGAAAVAMVGDVPYNNLQFGGIVCATKCPNNYILLTIGRAPFVAGVDPDLGAKLHQSFLIHVPTNSWVSFGSLSFSNNSTAHGYSAPFLHGSIGLNNTPWAFECVDSVRDVLYLMPWITNPEASTDVGADRHRDISSDGAASAEPDAYWYTRLYNPGGITDNAHLTRLFLDYKASFDTESSDDTISTTWQVYFLSRLTTQLGSTYTTTPSTATRTIPNDVYRRERRRAVGQLRAEADMVQAVVTWEPTGASAETLAPGGAEVYGVGIEYQISHQKRSGA